MAVQIKHYSFSRYSLYREVVNKLDRKECLNCDKTGKFRYYTESDSIGAHPQYFRGGFCSKECLFQYYNIYNEDV